MYDSVLLLERYFDYLSLKKAFLKYLKENFYEITPEFGFIKLENLLDIVREFTKSEISGFQQETPQNSDLESQIILFWAYLTGIIKILPLLLDRYVEEIFISPNTKIVTVDHNVFGRMRTNILISEKEKENILYRTAMENNLELNQLKPSIKGDLQVEGLFSLRITGDIPPFSYDGIILNIRKLNQVVFTLEKLITLHSLDPLTGALLSTFMSMGINITIIGSPSSGKTTLQNALLRELPSFWRVFSFENTLETNIRADNYFRFKIFDYLKLRKDLTSIFSQLLHRSPDFVNLGEITTSEEAFAWNACMSAGIPIIQTIHSNSSKGLIKRINKIFKISNGLLASSFPHIVVEVKYSWNNLRKERKIFSISEFIIDDNNKLKLIPLTDFNKETKSLNWLNDPKQSTTFRWLKANKDEFIEDTFNVNITRFQNIDL